MKKFIITFTVFAVGIFSAVGATITSFDDISLWAGTGTNKAALVIDFNDGTEQRAFAWGFRWNDGDYGIEGPTGADMLQAIAHADSNVVFTPQTYDYVASVFYMIAGSSHFQEAGFTPDWDYAFWAYYGVGGAQFSYDPADPFGPPIGTQSVAGGGSDLPTNWVALIAGAQGRFLTDGSWDAFVFGFADENWLPVEIPSPIVYASPAPPDKEKAIGTFTGVMHDGNGKIAGTWKMTASKAGKLTAQVVTVDATTGKLTKLAFKATSWAAPDPSKRSIYTAQMSIIKKINKVSTTTYTFEVSVDTALPWHSINVVGSYGKAVEPILSLTLEGQRNAFLDKPIKPAKTTPAMTYLTSYLGDWVAFYNAVADTWSTEKRKLAKGEVPTVKYLRIKVSKGGAIKYAGKIPVPSNKPISFSGSITLLDDEGDALMPVFNAIKASLTPEADIIELQQPQP